MKPRSVCIAVIYTIYLSDSILQCFETELLLREVTKEFKMSLIFPFSII